MKLAYIIVFLVVLFIRCDSAKDSVPDLDGTYVRVMTDEYGVLYDTLFIKAAGGDNLFSILKSSGIQNKGDDGKPLPFDYKQKQWTGIFDAEKKLLSIQDVGDYYQFDADKGTLNNGKVTFKKN